MADYPEEVLNSPNRFGSAICGDCGGEVKYDRLEIEKYRCPFCNSITLQITNIVIDSMEHKDSLRAKSKDDSFPSGKKIRTDIMTGYEKSQSNGKWVEKTRVIDKDNDRYLEHIVDPETKEILHHCEESLKKHQGHGQAKFKKEK